MPPKASAAQPAPHDPAADRRTAAFLAAVGEPIRVRIVRFLADGPKNVSEIAAAVGIPIVNASHHLGVMRAAGVASDEKDGRFVLYSLLDVEKKGNAVTVRGPGVSATIG